MQPGPPQGPPGPPHPSGSSSIDLGAVVRNTITAQQQQQQPQSHSKTFTQRWISADGSSSAAAGVPGTNRILVLDFGGSFNLFIPNMDGAGAGRDHSLFRTNTTNIEVVLKKMSNGAELTFMRFVFPNSPEISAPVLDNQKVRVTIANNASA